MRDTTAVEACLAAILAEYGPIRGLVHGAGVLADRRIEDQTDAKFAAVYDTKVAGLRSLLAAVRPDSDDLRVLVLFSSSTARFGRTGQVAYAAANEVLNKWARRGRDPPWLPGRLGQLGTVEGGHGHPWLKPLFEAEGIALIPARAGARYLVAEIEAGVDRPVEVVVLGGTSLPMIPTMTPRHEPPAPAPPKPPTLSTVFEGPVDVVAIPVLRSHVIDGRPVLPMALILEWLALGPCSGTRG